MTTVELVNLALLKLGHSKGITTLDDASREAWTAEQVFDHMLRATLRHFPWAFATKYLELSLARGPFWQTDPDELTRVQAWSGSASYLQGDVVREGGVNYYCIADHTNQQPPNASYWSTSQDDAPDQAVMNEWQYAYRWPTDCLFVRRLVNPSGVGRAFDPQPPRFRIGRDANGLLIYTNESAANAEYTVIDCDHLWADDLYIDAFTWRLASYLAPSLARDKDVAKLCYAMYLTTLEQAAAVGSREGQQDDEGDAAWVRARS